MIGKFLLNCLRGCILRALVFVWGPRIREYMEQLGPNEFVKVTERTLFGTKVHYLSPYTMDSYTLPDDPNSTKVTFQIVKEDSEEYRLDKTHFPNSHWEKYKIRKQEHPEQNITWLPECVGAPKQD